MTIRHLGRIGAGIAGWGRPADSDGQRSAVGALPRHGRQSRRRRLARRMARQRPVVPAADSNRDGVLSGDEVRAANADAGDNDGIGLVGDFGMIDLDGNGHVTSQEWRRAFTQLDDNRDGSLTQDELRIRNNRAPVVTRAFQAGRDRGVTDGRRAGARTRAARVGPRGTAGTGTGRRGLQQRTRPARSVSGGLSRRIQAGVLRRVRPASLKWRPRGGECTMAGDGTFAIASVALAAKTPASRARVTVEVPTNAGYVREAAGTRA